MPFSKARYMAAAGAVLLAMVAPAAVLAGADAYDSGSSARVRHYFAEIHRASYHGHFTDALELADRAVKESPDDANAYVVRAGVLSDVGKYQLATQDLDHAIAMHPDTVGLVMDEIRLILMQGRAADALAKLKFAATMPFESQWHNSGRFFSTQHRQSYMFEYASIAEFLQHHDDAGLAQMSAMMKQETVTPWHILADYCYLAAVAGRADMAEVTCQEAIDTHPEAFGQYDSMGFTELRLKEWGKAIAAYNTELESRSDLTLSLYGRGLARRAKGDVAGGNADIAAAKEGEPDIANIMKRLGAPDA